MFLGAKCSNEQGKETLVHIVSKECLLGKEVCATVMSQPPVVSVPIVEPLQTQLVGE